MSNYLPRVDTGYKSVYGNGKCRWCKFATITINGTWINCPVCFEVSSDGLGRLKSTLQVRFRNENSLDPLLVMFTTDDDERYYIKKTATSTWELYCQYSGVYEQFNLYRVINPEGPALIIDTTLENLETEPTDKIQCTLHSEGIEEQGSNYIRYSSGIQILWAEELFKASPGETVTYNFPKSFVRTPGIYIDGQSPSIYAAGWARTHLVVATNATVNIFISYTAIGRWK